MPNMTKRLRAVFATARLDHIKSWCSDSVAATGSPLVLRFGEAKMADGQDLVGVEGPAQHVMRVVGIVADQGEDFLMSVMPC